MKKKSMYSISTFIPFKLLTVSVVLSVFTACSSSNPKAPKEEKIEENTKKSINSNKVLPMEGAQNFRDLGGIATLDGKNVAWNKLFRSDKLSELTAQDVQKIQDLGIKTVIDLRIDHEVSAEPDKLPEGVNSIRIPMWNEAWAILTEGYNKDMDSLEQLEYRTKVKQVVADSYTSFPTAFKLESEKFLRLLSDENNYPILFHCTAGTDRTGYLAALTLSLLNVDEQTILEDYALSAQLRLNQDGDNRIEATLNSFKSLGGVNAYIKDMQQVDVTKIKHVLLD